MKSTYESKLHDSDQLISKLQRKVLSLSQQNTLSTRRTDCPYYERILKDGQKDIYLRKRQSVDNIDRSTLDEYSPSSFYFLASASKHNPYTNLTETQSKSDFRQDFDRY